MHRLEPKPSRHCINYDFRCEKRGKEAKSKLVSDVLLLSWTTIAPAQLGSCNTRIDAGICCTEQQSCPDQGWLQPSSGGAERTQVPWTRPDVGRRSPCRQFCGTYQTPSQQRHEIAVGASQSQQLNFYLAGRFWGAFTYFAPHVSLEKEQMEMELAFLSISH